MITKNQFDVLEAAVSGETVLTQEALAAAVNMPSAEISAAVRSLNEAGCLQGMSLTADGREVIESFRVKRAVFIAAGFGSRLVPITLSTAKPLVRIKGKRMIDTLLDAVTAAGIEEIYIVRGYLPEQFDQLLHKYPTIKFIENPDYAETNNIASMMCARHLLQNAYVLEADLYLYNPSLIRKYQYSSNYLGMPAAVTDDWCFMTENGIIRKLLIGGTDCHHMFGISYWTAEDGRKLADHLEKVFTSPGGRERYWDQVPLEYFLDEYSVSVRECSRGDIIEIDTFSELKAIDSNYAI